MEKSVYSKRNRSFLIRAILYLIGVSIMPLGIVLTVNSNLGAGGYDTLNFALSNLLGIRISYAIYLTSFICLLIAALIRRKKPRISTFVTSIFIGLFTDFWKTLLGDSASSELMKSLLLLFIGMVIVSFAAAAYMLSSFPTNPTDDLVMAVFEQGIPLSVAKIGFDCIAVIFALFIGGNISWGTLLITIGIGPIVDVFYRLLGKLVSKGIREMEG